MAQFKIAEIEVGPGNKPCLLVFGGKRNPETRDRIEQSARRLRPDWSRVILWDAPDGKALGFDGPFELTPFFSSSNPEELRSRITGELEA